MFPISLNLATVPVLLIGDGQAFEKRKAQLLANGACHLTCHSHESGNPAFTKEELDSRLRGNDTRIVLVAGLDHSISEMIANEARKLGKLVNVEDVPELCDFYFTSFVARGDLTIAVSTNGASPTLAKRVREKISTCFPEVWAERTAVIKTLRDKLRSEGKSMREVMVETDNFIDEQAWITPCVGIKQ